MGGCGGFEPVPDGNCKPQSGGNSDNLMMGLLGAAVAFFALYFIIKSGVKNGILEALEESKLPFLNDCR